jgi:hypothetical protein
VFTRKEGKEDLLDYEFPKKTYVGFRGEFSFEGDNCPENMMYDLVLGAGNVSNQAHLTLVPFNEVFSIKSQ